MVCKRSWAVDCTFVSKLEHPWRCGDGTSSVRPVPSTYGHLGTAPQVLSLCLVKLVGSSGPSKSACTTSRGA